MGIDKFINSMIQSGFVSEEDALHALAERFKGINLRDYNILVSAVKKFHIDDDTFFKYVYMNASENVQYQMWKDGYIESCPAGKLLKDIVSEDEDVVKILKIDYDEELLQCEAYFKGIQDVIISYISKAKESLKIAMAWFTNPAIFNVLCRASKRGVEVHLLINNDLINNRPNGLPFNKLISDGTNLYIAEFPDLIHNKFCIIDDSIVIDGSYNWTILAEKNNDENIVVLKNGKVIDSFINAFEKLIYNYEQVDEMPTRVPDKPEYDYSSCRFFNSEEWLEQVGSVSSKRKRHEIYKNVFRNLSEEIAREKIPSEIFDSIKEEVEEEQNKDANLFNHSMNQKSEELQQDLTNNERKIEKLSQKVDAIILKKTREIEKHKTRLQTIKSKKIPKGQKEAQLSELRKKHQRELNKLNRSIFSKKTEIDVLQEESETIEQQQGLVTTLQNSELQGSNGLCRINLKWNTADDLDLHLILPNGTLDGEKDVYYSHMQAEYNGGVCSLDHDAIPDHSGENPQENIVWSNKLPDGRYRIKVKLYNKKSNTNSIPFTVTAFTGNYVKTEVFNFQNATSGNVIDIATLTFKNGKVVTPIKFTKGSK